MTKILYYNYFIKKGNTKTNASLIPLLEHINSLAPSLGEREKDIYINGKLERILLTEIHSPLKNEINNIIDSKARIITFSRKRKNNPYIADDGSDQYTQIPENRKILELATALIIPRKNLILLQRNIHSTSIKIISKYLSEFLNDSFTLQFTPIKTDNKLDDILHSKYISKIELKFSTEKLTESIGTIEQKKFDSVFVELVESQSKVANVTGSPDTHITFSNGLTRNSLKIDETINFINFIRNITPEDSPLKSIKIKYKPSPTKKVQEIDLVVDGIRSFDIHLDSNGGEYVGNCICKAYYDNPYNLYNEEFNTLVHYDFISQSDFI